MTNIELVIKIPEDKYKEIVSGIFNADGYFKTNLTLAFRNGIPLPKGHGDIVDIETLIDMFWDGNSMEITNDDFSVIEPIIKADKTESER